MAVAKRILHPSCASGAVRSAGRELTTDRRFVTTTNSQPGTGRTGHRAALECTSDGR